MDLSLLRLIEAIPQKFKRALTLRFDRSPFDTVDKLTEFVQTRAAYVTQTSLYGYLKTRMGTRYRVMFEDEVFSQSINFAKWRIYASCLTDLAVFAAATVHERTGLDKDQTAKLAHFCFESAITADFQDADDAELTARVLENFSARLQRTDWSTAGSGENAFEKSPHDLVKWAPIADELKELDEEIVVNSTRFRWRDVREQLRKRIDAEAVANEWGRTWKTRKVNDGERAAE